MTIEQNHFYTLTPYSSRESVLAISAWDYSPGKIDLSEILSQGMHAKKFVISSSVWGMKDSEQICASLQNNPLCRLQISWGAEFYRHMGKVLSFLENSGRVDVLIDRPVDSESLEEISVLCQSFDVRLCVIVNRYFSVEETVKSLGVELRTCVVLNFPPPSDKKSPFLSPDEVIKVMENLMKDGDIKAIIFDNILESTTDLKDAKFYARLSREDYFSGSVLLDQCRALRVVIFWLIRKKLILLLDGLYAVLIFLKNPSWKLAISPLRFLWDYLVLKMKTGARAAYCFIRYDIFHFFRYDMYHFFRYNVFHFFRYRLSHLIQTKVLDFFRYRLPHFYHVKIFPFFRYQIPHWYRTNLEQFLRYKLPHYIRVGWDRVALVLMLFFRYRIPHVVRTYCPRVLYPLYKLYWFSSYQFQKRILPHFRKKVREE